MKKIFILGFIFLSVGPSLRADTLIHYQFDGVSFPDALVVQDTSGNHFDLHFCRAIGISEKSAKDELTSVDDTNDRSADVTNNLSSLIWGKVQGSLPPIKSFTLEGWVNPVNFKDGADIWVLVDRVSGSRIVLGYDNAGTVNATVVDEGAKAQQLVDAASVIRRGEWNHLALTFNGEQFSLVVNGKETASLRVEGGFTFQSPEITFFGGDRGFDGFCDEFRLSDTALSTEELGWSAVQK